jgi:hypothetical protein
MTPLASRTEIFLFFSPEARPEDGHEPRLSIEDRIWGSVERFFSGFSFPSPSSSISCCFARERFPEEEEDTPLLTNEFFASLYKNYKIVDTLRILNYEQQKIVTLTGSSPQITFDIIRKSRSGEEFVIDKQMIEDCTRFQATINNKKLGINYANDHELEKEAFFSKVLETILENIPQTGPKRSKIITKISRLFNASVAIDLAVQANTCFTSSRGKRNYRSQDFSLRKKGEYRLYLVVSRRRLILSCKLFFEVVLRSDPYHPLLLLEGKVKHCLRRNTASYRFAPLPFTM